MSDQLLEKLEGELRDAEYTIKERKEGIDRLKDEIHLNESVAKNDTFKEDASKEDQEALKYGTIALGDIMRWEQSRLAETEQKKRILEFKIKFRKNQKKGS